MKLVTSMFKEDPIQKELKKLGLFCDGLGRLVIEATRELFLKRAGEGEEEHFLKVVIKQL